ncbi:Rhamnosyl O-methyltransferase [Durusdinium trenchii]|uniref:Rhamnosyl O-methyltransferase n=1 Tax=Durusdinium trenchii TaxID=1381693 RepID=A0ABP0JAE9_9DINO
MACRDLSKQSLSAAGLLTALTFQAAAVQVTVQVPASSLERWRRMCREEQQDEGSLLSGLITTRQELLDAEIVPRPVATGVPTASSSEAGSCGRFGYQSPDDAKDIFSFARTELDCPEIFMKAVVIYGRHLLSQKRLHEFDILHEVIRAETGYKSNKMSGKSFAMKVFEDFMDFQEDLASALEGWALWEYEFKHWRYSKRRAGGDEYSQLYNTHRLPDYQHLLCPAIPLAFRRWSNFPTCPPTRLRDLARFTDAHVAGMTVDNWRASYRDFLSEDYNFNVSHFAGGDPTERLSKGAHSLFAGVFIQKMPTDLWCYQQVIHDLRPQYIIDLGSSQGGSAVWFASMLKLFEIPGKVISVDLALEQAYWLTKTRAEAAAKRLKVSKFIDWNYVVGGSKNKEVREKVERLCSEAPCMVVSDSDHDFEHTYYEMEWYAQHVGIGQYLIVEDTNIYGWTGWMNINDPNEADLKKGPMEAANDFEFKHRADFIRTDWCAKHYGGLSQTQNGWFFRKAKRARGLSD